MTKPTGGPRNLNLILGLLLGIAIGSSVLVGISGSGSLPEWCGAVIGVAALVGALVVLWRQGAAKARYVVFFVATIICAPLLAWLLSEYA